MMTERLNLMRAAYGNNRSNGRNTLPILAARLKFNSTELNDGFIEQGTTHRHIIMGRCGPNPTHAEYGLTILAH